MRTDARLALFHRTVKLMRLLANNASDLKMNVNQSDRRKIDIVRAPIKATQDNAPLMAVVLPPINEVIDLHSVHLAMARRHLPIPIMTLLLGTAVISLGMVGFGNGRMGRRFSVLDSVYRAVLAVALWMTIDLNYPGIGLIRVSNLPVTETLAAMR